MQNKQGTGVKLFILYQTPLELLLERLAPSFESSTVRTIDFTEQWK